MSILLIRIEWTDKQQITRTFTDVEKVSLKRNSESKASNANIKLKNAIDKFVTGYVPPFAKYVSILNETQFNEGDTVKIYAAQVDSFRTIDTSTGSTDLLMTGEIAEVKSKSTEKGTTIKLRIVDKTFVILNKLWTFSYDATVGKTAPQIVKDVVRQITGEIVEGEAGYIDNGDFQIPGSFGIDARLATDDPPNSDGEKGFIEDRRQDDSVFPVTTIAKVFKPAYEFINDISTLEHTNDFSTESKDDPPQDRKMLFFVDERNRFHWFYPNDSSTDSLSSSINSTDTIIPLNNSTGFPTIGKVAIGSETISYTGIIGNDLTGVTRGAEGTDAQSHLGGAVVSSALLFIEGDTSTGNKIISYNLKLATFDITNFVIFNSGKDLFGSGILDYFYDRNTTEKQLKMIYKPWTEIARDHINKELEDERITKDNTQANFTWEGNFYKETTGNYNAGAGITTSWGTVVTTDAEYNTAVRDISQSDGQARAKAFTEKTGSPRYKGTIQVKFKRYTAGDLINFTSTRAGINKRDLRIKTASYTLGKTGGFVVLNVEEDEKKTGET